MNSSLMEYTNQSHQEQVSGASVSSSSVIGFSVIATMAFLSNAFLCVMLLVYRKMMTKNSCHVFILSLAFSDMMTGVGLLVTPSFILSSNHLHPPSGFFGYVFCSILASKYLIFTLGIVSVYTITIIAIERWHAVIIPIKYKARFSLKHCKIYIAVIWFTSCVMNCSTLFDLTLSNDVSMGCVTRDSTIGKMKLVVAVGEFLAKFAIPLIICFASFIHLYIRVHNSAMLMEGRRGRTTMKLLRMCAVTAAALALCWIPNQVLYLLFKFNQADLDTPLHNFTVILAMTNSCINPWLYCATNSTYRGIFKKTLLCCFFSGSKIDDMTDTHPGTVLFRRVRHDHVIDEHDQGHHDRYNSPGCNSPDGFYVIR